MNKHKGRRRVQKRPNYKNVGEEDDEEKGPAEDTPEDAEKAKGTEGGSKGMKTSGENEGECARERHPATRAAGEVVICVGSPRVSAGASLRPRHQCASLCATQLFRGRFGTRPGPALTGRVTWHRVLYNQLMPQFPHL